MRRWYSLAAAIGGLLLLAGCQSAAPTAPAPPAAQAAAAPMGGGTSSQMAASDAPMMRSAAEFETTTADQLDERLVADLQKGGYVIYFRHARTDRSQQDSDPQNLANCATQRNLTDEGRADARALGEALRTLQVPVGQVLSSAYCRAREHALLSFDKATDEPSLVLPDPLPADERERNTEALQRLLATPPPPGTNTVLVSHSPNMKDAADVDLTVEGGAAILRPTNGRPVVVTLVLPNEWISLAEATGSP
jgi:phosphohistidine phosphatase SixA